MELTGPLPVVGKKRLLPMQIWAEDVNAKGWFFFQAEDGIRYYKVTGVQTCALPISDRVADLVLAVGELAANTIRHADQGGVLAIWTAGNELICQVQDSGHIADPL